MKFLTKVGVPVERMGTTIRIKSSDGYNGTALIYYSTGYESDFLHW
jgi:hypothetical protein